MNKKALSYIILISSMAVFGTVGVFRRYIQFDSGLLSMLRGFIGCGSIAVFMKLTGKKFDRSIKGKQLFLGALSGCLIGLNWMLFFEALNRTTVGVATLCYYMSPTMVVLLSPIVLKERLTPKRIFFAALSLVGMVLVSGIIEEEIRGIDGVIFSLCAAAMYTVIVFANKKMKKCDAYSITAVQLFFAASVMVIYLLIKALVSGGGFIPELDTTSVIMTLILGIFHTGVAYVTYFATIPELSGQAVATLSYIDPVTALILSMTFLGEPFSVWGIVGAVLIIGSAVLSEISFPLSRRAK